MPDSQLNMYQASMTITQYLGTGSTSRGRMVITPQLNTRVSVPPYLREADDKAAVVEGLERVRKYFQPISNLTWVRPASNQTSTQFVDSVSVFQTSAPFYPLYAHEPHEVTPFSARTRIEFSNN